MIVSNHPWKSITSLPPRDLEIDLVANYRRSLSTRRSAMRLSCFGSGGCGRLSMAARSQSVLSPEVLWGVGIKSAEESMDLTYVRPTRENKGQ